MRAVWAICRRDLIHLFTTPLAWLVLFMWTMVLNLAFFLGLLPFLSDGATAEPTMSAEPLYLLSLRLGALLFVLLSPAITMNSFAAEGVHGTLPLLLTAPIRESQLVLGKFLAAWAMLLVMVAGTLPQPLLLYFISEIDVPQLTAGYLSFSLLAALLAAIGVWISVLVDHPIAAYVITAGIIGVLLLLGAGSYTDDGLFHIAGTYLGLTARYDAGFVGNLRLADILFFVAGTAICLVLTHAALLARRVHG